MMRKFLLCFLFLASGCVQTENSSSLDAGMYGGDSSDSAFTQVKTILIVNCNSCHLYGSYSQQEFINDGLVIAGDPDNSPLYMSLRGSQAPSGRKDMPVSGILSQAEQQAIRDWILNL